MEKKIRKILVVLYNRVSPNQPTRYTELETKSDGTITRELALKRKPRTAIYDEVWENDEGKEALKYCNRVRRIYRHPLEKPRR